MAEGIVAAVIEKGVYPREAIVVSDPVEARRQFFAERFGVAVTADNRQLVRDARRVLLAVKPQMFDAAAAELADVVTGEHLFITIMAGKSTARVAAALAGKKAEEDAGRDSREAKSAGRDSRTSSARAGDGFVRVVRVMPNLPIRVGAGMAGICRGEHATAGDVEDVQRILNAGGSSVVVSDETLMDAVTAVSGSGPAYFYYFVEAMVEGGKACGLTEGESLALAEYTCLGAARMMLETGEPPAELRAKVTSKGGTTFAALESMRQAGVDVAIREAVRAAFNRGRELGA
jgi:pyrroline-5-carboxylate reductase